MTSERQQSDDAPVDIKTVFKHIWEALS
jgi:hypothetical protein